MKRSINTAAIAALLGLAAPSTAAKAPDTWDGLLRVKAKKVENVYLLPNADFRGYTKVMLEPTQVAFRKNWQRDINRGTGGFDRHVSDADARRILDEATAGFIGDFHKAFTDAGYQIVTAPGPDVLRISTAVINLAVDAPDTMSATVTRTYTPEAGEATLVVEAEDSVTGQILGRAVDERVIGDAAPYLRNRASNRGDFERMFRHWAKLSAEGLGELKSLSPIDTEGQLRR